MKNERVTERSYYLLISNQVIKDVLAKSDTQVIDEKLIKQGFSEVLIYMIRQGYARQLRTDCFNILSEVLGRNIGADYGI